MVPGMGANKICTACDNCLPANSKYFGKSKYSHDGFRWECKECTKERSRVWYQRFADRERKLSRNRRAAFRNNKRNEYLTSNKKWARANPEKVREIKRTWRKKNIEVLRRKDSEYVLRRESNDLGYKLHNRFSNLLRISMCGNKGGRKWESIVGYDVCDLHRHLERQFLPGMSWDNYGRGKGKWQIDHIIPRSTFGLVQTNKIHF